MQKFPYFNFSKINSKNNLVGKLLIATPHSTLNSMFEESLIYVITHTSEGALGIIVNHSINRSSFYKILKLMHEKIGDASTEYLDASDIKIYLGGPTSPDKGFVIHSPDYSKDPISSSEDIAISSNLDIIKDISEGRGPKRSLLAMGYTEWSEGQLEQEILSNYWIITEADAELIFSEDDHIKWESALSKHGIDTTLFSPKLGNA